MATPEIVAEPLIERVRVAIGGTSPMFIALDGRSGSGKSTVAAVVQHTFDLDPERGEPLVTVIEGDQFYGGGSAATWDGRTAEDKVARVIDWRRQLALLRQLREHGRAEWRAFDWEAEDWDADVVPLRPDPLVCRATPVVLLEGAYSAWPEFGDLVDLRVLLDPPRHVRRRQLLAREGDLYRDDWEARWSTAEDHYFGTIMPPDRFDLVLRAE